MNGKLSIFRIVVLVIFGAFALIGFLLFASYSPKAEEGQVQVGNVEIWGTIDRQIVESVLLQIQSQNSSFEKVKYVEKNINTYNLEILEAIATNTAPDLILVSNDNIFTNLNKIYKIPYTAFLQRDYLSTYADAFSIFAFQDGISTIPFMIDPLVMYYNKEIFRSNAVVSPPQKWNELGQLSKKITEFDDQGNIKRATIALGSTNNINNFSDIISTFIMQSRNEIIEFKDQKFSSVEFDTNFKNPTSGILFFTEFTNNLSPLYSWNKNLPKSRDYFLANKLAIYLGFASEVRGLRLKNPNLNFNVAEIPSLEKIENKKAFARVWGFSILNSSNNKEGAFAVATELSGSSAQKFLSEKLFLPPVLKSLLGQRHPEPFMDIFYREAIYSDSFINPNKQEVDKIFNFMINSVKSGRQSPFQSISTSFKEIEILFRR